MQNFQIFCPIIHPTVCSPIIQSIPPFARPFADPSIHLAVSPTDIPVSSPLKSLSQELCSKWVIQQANERQTVRAELSKQGSGLNKKVSGQAIKRCIFQQGQSISTGQSMRLQSVTFMHDCRCFCCRRCRH